MPQYTSLGRRVERQLKDAMPVSASSSSARHPRRLAIFCDHTCTRIVMAEIGKGTVRLLAMPSSRKSEITITSRAAGTSHQIRGQLEKIRFAFGFQPAEK